MNWVDYTGEPKGDIHLQNLINLSLEYTQLVEPENWNIDNLFDEPVPGIVYEKLGATILNMDDPFKYDKIAIKYPDMLFFLPWVARIMPYAHFLEIVRDPRDVIRGGYLDHLDSKLIPSDIDNPLLYHAHILLYQFRIVKQFKERFSNIKHLRVRHEDLVCSHEETVQKIENFLRTPLSRIPVDSSRVYRWIKGEYKTIRNYPLFHEMLEEYGYPLERNQ